MDDCDLLLRGLHAGDRDCQHERLLPRAARLPRVPGEGGGGGGPYAAAATAVPLPSSPALVLQLRFLNSGPITAVTVNGQAIAYNRCGRTASNRRLPPASQFYWDFSLQVRRQR